MKTKSRKSQPEIFSSDIRDTKPEKPDSPGSPGPASSGTETGREKERFQVSFDLNADGSPDLSSMRGKTKERVQSFFSDPKMAAAFGSKPVTPEVQVFPPGVVGGLYDLLGSIEAMIAIRYWNTPPFIAKQVFTYSPAEKDALGGPTVRVLNKYAADWMIKYQDELALATLLVSLTISKLNVCRALMLQHQRGSATTPGPASQEKNTPGGYENEGMDPGVKPS